jgi:hypothetical protein
VVGDQHGGAILRQGADQRLQTFDGDRVDPAERLVQEEHPRTDGQQAGDLQPAPLAAGEAIDPSGGERGDAHPRQQGQGILPGPGHLDAHPHVVRHVEVTEKGVLLRQVAESEAGAGR